MARVALESEVGVEGVYRIPSALDGFSWWRFSEDDVPEGTQHTVTDPDNFVNVRLPNTITPLKVLQRDSEGNAIRCLFRVDDFVKKSRH